MAATIGELVVNLRASTASFISDLDKSRSKSAAFGVAVGKIMADVASAVARVGVEAALALPRLAASSIDTADKLNKSAQKYGVAVEQLSALKYAAELADVPFEALETSAGRLSRQMAELASGSNSAKSIFQQLGIEAQRSDGTLRPVDEVLADIADRFAATEDGAQKTALAIQLFGKSGAQLIPLLNAGKAGLAAMTEEAKALGLVISTETAQRAEAFNDNMTKLKAAVVGVGNALASGMLPDLQKFTEEVKRFVKDSDGADRIANSFSFLFKEIVTVGAVAVGVMKQILIGAAGLIQASESVAKASFFNLTFRPWKAGEELRKASATIGIALEEMKENFALSKEGIEKIWDEVAVKLSKPPKLAASNFREIEEAVSAEVLKLQKMLNVPVEFGPVKITPDLVKLLEGVLSEKPIPVQVPISAQLEPLREDAFRAVDIWAEGIRDRLAALQNEHDFALSIAGVMDTDFQKELYAGVREELELTSQKTKEVTEASRDYAHAISTNLEQAILKFDGMRNVLKGILDDIAAIALRVSVTKPIEDALTEAFSKNGGGARGFFSGLAGIGSSIAGLFGGGRAMGGPVSAGRAYLVGEQRPEIFVPGSSGTILPSVGGSGVTVNNYIDARGADAGVEGRIARAMRLTHQASVENALRISREMQLRTA